MDAKQQLLEQDEFENSHFVDKTPAENAEEKYAEFDLQFDEGAE